MTAKISNEIEIFRRIQKIITYPEESIPSMSEDEIKITLIEATLAYIENNLHLGTLIMFATKLQIFIGKREIRNANLIESLTKINSLSMYLKNTEDSANNVNDVLVKVLDELMKE